VIVTVRSVFIVSISSVLTFMLQTQNQGKTGHALVTVKRH